MPALLNEVHPIKECASADDYRCNPCSRHDNLLYVCSVISGFLENAARASLPSFEEIERSLILENIYGGNLFLM